MKESLCEADRSLTFYVAAAREQPAIVAERTLIAWAALALVMVLLAITIGGCA